MTRNDITDDLIAIAKAWCETLDWIFFGKSSQCGDCNGTRKVDGKPCRICCPTDDGPEKEGMKL
jgi:hypothetical protein